MTRLEKLQTLLDEYRASVEDYDAGEEEDLRPYFDGEEEPAQWCCVDGQLHIARSCKVFLPADVQQQR